MQFALKKGRKKPLVAAAGFASAAPTAPRAPEKIFVTDFDPEGPAESADGAPPLVIPLKETNAWQGDAQEETTPDEDTAAARQLLDEVKQKENNDHTPLVIAAKRAELFQDAEKRKSGAKKVPILQQNAVPGMDQLQDVTDKYRHDVAMRPDAPDVLGDGYEAVPVEEFGAALLRGMGWKGSVDPDDVGEAPQPRHKLLGLGATKRPTLPGEDKKKRKKRKKQEPPEERSSGLNDRDDRRERRERSPSDRRARDDSRDRRRRSRSRERDSDRRDRSRNERDRSRDRDRRGRDRRRSDRRSRSSDRRRR